MPTLHIRRYIHCYVYFASRISKYSSSVRCTNTSLLSQTLVRLDDANGLSLDNFEGLTRHRGQRYFMVSDNNDVFVQRTLLLYFEILDAK